MIDHVKFGATDYEANKDFFLAALEPLGRSLIRSTESSGLGSGGNETSADKAAA